MNIEGRLSINAEVQQQYQEFMKEYENLGHMIRLDQQEECIARYFIPHHFVMKPTSSSTKLRAVFDASCKTSPGMSLNYILKTGPVIQQRSIFNHFRIPAI